MPASEVVKCLVLAMSIVLTAFPGRAVAQDAKKCILSMRASLDFRTTPEGRVSIPVKVQGRELFFLIDTGGIYGTIDPGVAASLKLQPKTGDVPLFGVGGALLNRTVEVQDFTFSHFAVVKPYFYLEPASWRGTDGTLAPGLLRNFDLDFDFAAGKLNLFSPDHCEGNVVYWTKEPIAIVSMLRYSEGGHIRIPITIDGKDMTATVDTGATRSIMSMRAAHHFLDIDEKDPNLKAIGSDSQISYLYPFKRASFENVSVSNPYIVILPDKDMKNMGTDMILGMSTLRQLHMYVAYKERKLYLSSATAH